MSSTPSGIPKRPPEPSQDPPRTLPFPRGPPEHLWAPPGPARDPTINKKTTVVFLA